MSTPRQHIIGLDKPTAAPLRSAADPTAQLATQASIHERHRLDSIAEVLALVALLTARKVLIGHETVSVRGAVYQWGQGVSTDATVGAHCLPGQLLFNGSALHDCPHWTPQFLTDRGFKALPLSSKLRNLSARTDVVDSVVNTTDSLLERMGGQRGLKPQFGAVARQLMTQTRLHVPNNPTALAQSIGLAMSQYRLGAAYACEERLGQLSQEVGTSPDSAGNERRSRQALVIRQYLAVLRGRAHAPVYASVGGLALLMRDVLQDSG